MSDDTDQNNESNDQTTPKPSEFDFSKFPYNTLFHERREGRDRRDKGTPASEQKEAASPQAPPTGAPRRTGGGASIPRPSTSSTPMMNWSS